MNLSSPFKIKFDFDKVKDWYHDEENWHKIREKVPVGELNKRVNEHVEEIYSSNEEWEEYRKKNNITQKYPPGGVSIHRDENKPDMVKHLESLKQEVRD